MAELQKNAIGTIIRRTVKEDNVVVNLASSSVRQLKFRKPNGAVIIKTAVFTTDGVNGQLEYVTVANDLDQVGTWHGQVYLEFSNGKWHSSSFHFEVNQAL